MTREEALRRMKKMRWLVVQKTGGFEVEAYDTAIRSLEAWDKVIDDLTFDDFEGATSGFQRAIKYANITIRKHLEEVEE